MGFGGKAALPVETVPETKPGLIDVKAGFSTQC
jgi:hypothetical protein